MPPNNLKVSAAIDELISSDKFELGAARRIIHFAWKIPELGFMKTETSEDDTDPPSMQGYAAGFGNVDYAPNNDRKSGKKIPDKYKVRVGNYKLEKRASDIISFQHFWKSDLVTAGSDGMIPSIYHLHFDDRLTLRPLALSIDEWSQPFTLFVFPDISLRKIWVVKIILRYERYLYGKKKGQRKRYGFSLYRYTWEPD